MSDPFEDHMESRLGLNEPPPEEPTPAQKHVQAANERMERNSWRRANLDALLVIDALRKNGDAKL